MDEIQGIGNSFEELFKILENNLEKDCGWHEGTVCEISYRISQLDDISKWIEATKEINGRSVKHAGCNCIQKIYDAAEKKTESSELPFQYKPGVSIRDDIGESPDSRSPDVPVKSSPKAKKWFKRFSLSRSIADVTRRIQELQKSKKRKSEQVFATKSGDSSSGP